MEERGWHHSVVRPKEELPYSLVDRAAEFHGFSKILSLLPVLHDLDWLLPRY